MIAYAGWQRLAAGERAVSTSLYDPLAYRRTGPAPSGPSMMPVFIDGLQVGAVIGIYAWERSVLQDFIDLRLDTNIGAAAGRTTSTSRSTTTHRRPRHRLAGASRHKLIESLAEEIARTVLGEFGVKRLMVRVTKPGAVANARGVGVEIERP